MAPIDETTRSESRVDEAMQQLGISYFSEIVYRNLPAEILERIKQSNKLTVCEAIAVPTANIRTLTTLVTCLVKGYDYFLLSFTDDSPKSNPITVPHKGTLKLNPDRTASNIVSRTQLDENPRLADVVTVHGQSLLEYHNTLLSQWFGDLAPCGFDLSGIFKEATIEFLLNYDVNTNLVDLASIDLICLPKPLRENLNFPEGSFLSVSNDPSLMIKANEIVAWISSQRQAKIDEDTIRNKLSEMVIRMDGASYYGTVPLYPAVLSCLGLNLLEYFTPGEGQSIFGPLWSKGVSFLGINNISHIQQPLYEPLDRDNWVNNPLLSHKYIPEKLRDPNKIIQFRDRFLNYLDANQVNIDKESFYSICEYCYRFLVIEFYGDLEV